MPHSFTRMLIALLLLVLAACGPASQAPAPTPAPTAAPPQALTAAPSPTPMPATPTQAPSPTPSGPSPTPDLPTAAPTITAVPAQPAYPLASGWWDSAVCYEIFVRSFYDSDGDGIGDFNGLIQKLDYINDGDPATSTDLGASCLWLMPIMPSNTYHGYAVTDFYAVNPQFGSMADFKRLLAEAHRRGVTVLIDMVLNHTSREHPWFQEALQGPGTAHRDWYLWSKDEPPSQGWHASPARDEYYYSAFDGGLPDLNYRNPAVTAEAYKISAFWLNEVGVDGFRMDAAKHLIENGPATADTPETNAWLREYRAFLSQAAPGAFTIGENFGSSSIALAAYYPDQLDMYFEFNLGLKILQAVNLGNANQYIGAARAAYEDLPFQRWAPFLTNHDQNRTMSAFGNRPERAKLAAIALLTLPGMPFIYYGEEIGMLGAKPDEQIRTPMQWDATPSGGFTSGTPWVPPQPNVAETNVAAQDHDADSLLNLYRRLIQLHTSNPALSTGDFTPLKSNNPGVAAFIRRHTSGEAVLVVLNFGRAPAEGLELALDAGGLPAGSYTLEPLLAGQASGAPLVVGTGGTITGYTPLATLPARSGYIFRLAP